MKAYFRFRAARDSGRIVTGVISASDSGHAAALIVNQGLHPLSLVAVAAEGLRRRRASRPQLALAFRSLASLTAAGVGLERALFVTIPLCREPLREALRQTHRQIREGQGLADALDSAGGVVPPLSIGILRAGERGSALGNALEEAAQLLEQEADLRSRLTQALVYPLLLAITGVTSLAVITTVVVPRFAQLLGELGQNLPPATRALLTVSSLAGRFGMLLVGLLVGSLLLLHRWAATERGAQTTHAILHRLPVIGPLRLSMATARIGRTLGGMLGAGIPILGALDGAGESVGDAHIQIRLREARQRILHGATIASALRDVRAVTPAAAQLLTIGEESGRLPELARRAGDLAAGEVERRLRNLVTLLEPSLVILFGGIIAFVAGALLQAVYALRPAAA